MKDWCFGLSVAKRWRSKNTFEVVIIILFFEITLTFKERGK